MDLLYIPDREEQIAVERQINKELHVLANADIDDCYSTATLKEDEQQSDIITETSSIIIANH